MVGGGAPAGAVSWTTWNAAVLSSQRSGAEEDEAKSPGGMNKAFELGDRGPADTPASCMSGGA